MSMNWTKERLSELSYTKLLQLYKVMNGGSFNILMKFQAMLDIAIIFLAVMSQVLSWVSIGKSFQLFANARRKLSRRDLRQSINSSDTSAHANISWGSLPLRTKLRFFNMRFVITILGNLANISAAFLDFFVAEDAETVNAIKCTFLDCISRAR